jgi:hypothetical protein
MMNLSDLSFEEKPVLEEHAVAERRGMFGGRSLHTTQEGKFERTSFVLTCDICGHYPLNEFVVCRKCKGRLCKVCANWLDGRPYDRACLMEILPVSINAYKVMLCVESGVESPGKISDLTRISKDDIKASLAHLTELKLVETKGMLVFLERKVTAEGIRALSVYKKVYGSEDDVREVQEQLAEGKEVGD